jgi:hypothetical protein
MSYRGRKGLDLGFGWLCTIGRHHFPIWIPIALQPVSGTFLKNSSEGKYSQWRKVQTV